MKSEERRKRRTSEHNKALSAKNKASRRRMRIAALCAFGLGIVSVVTISTTTTATASGCDDPFSNQAGCNVPEISALEGTAALAVIAAMLLLAWERRRRA